MRRIRWGDVLLSSVAAVGWSLIVMAAVAGLGLHLLGADAAGAGATEGSLGAMTAAAVVLAIGGTVTPSGDVSVLGVIGTGAETALDVMPLGVSLAGALVLALLFLRSLRADAGHGETAARVVVLAVLFVATAGGLAWIGHDVVTLDGTLPLPQTPAKVEIPGIGDIGGLLPDRIGDLIETRTRVGFSVELGPTLLGAGVWVLAVLALALLVSRRGPAAAARLRPVVSAVVAMLLVAVAAGWAAAVWAALGDDHPRRVLGGALLGAPNGSWLGVLLGLFVPVHGRVTGASARLLPDPLDDLVAVPAREPVTVSRLAEYDGRVWLLVAGAALLLLYAGVLAAVRTPGRGVLGCAARLSAATGVALAVLVWLTGFSAGASLAVPGVDAVDAGVELRGDVPYALLLGALWGAVAGAAGAALAPRRRAALPRPAGAPGPAPGWPAPGRPTAPYPGAGPYGGPPGGPRPAGGGEADGSWDVTVTGVPPWSPRSPRPSGPSRSPGPPRREPFTPPPPPGGPPPPPKPPHPPTPPR
ncbi:streptophobe family protein [Streptomyces virginiae]|uniref:streptophobe family protein n=1 Tax=Streptomyces virginiae TaxID=1961 RepID=UPI002259534B|nr:streptophobe family protein [Streptomyces virginiae]MCX4961955.1 streptophobe family protein [Streptomyces virginiae]MCX5180097.1 streptophobe family protein [Streptomyces virginiae]